MTSIELIYKSLKTLKEMLNDRGINTSNIDNIEALEIKELINPSIMVFVLDINENFRVIYTLSKFNVSSFKKYLTDKKVNHIMFISKEKLTGSHLRSLSVEPYNLIDFEFFKIEELSFNISRHKLVPLHELIRDKNEIQNIMDKHKVKLKSQFPLITKEDPMAKYLHAKSGDLIKITRNSISSGIFYVYRCCV